MTPLDIAIEELKQDFNLSNEQTVSLLEQYINTIEQKQSTVSLNLNKRSNNYGENI